MKRILFLMLALTLGGCATATDTNLYGRFLVQSSYAEPTCATATGNGDFCAADAIEAEGALDVAGTSTLTGAVAAGSTLTVAGATTLTGNITANGTITENKIYETFAEGAAGKGYVLLAHTGLAWSGTAGALNHVYTGGGNVFNMAATGDNQAVAPVMAAEGLDIAGDQADNEGYEIWTGAQGASGRGYIIGTDPAFYFHVGIDIDDVSGTDVLICGFRLLEAYNQDSRAYNTYFGIGSDTEANPMALEVIEELNGAAGATTDTTQTLADGIAYEAKIFVSGAGVATLTHDAATPGVQAAPTATSTFTFDDGDLVVPFCSYEQANATQTAGFSITHWEAGLQ